MVQGFGWSGVHRQAQSLARAACPFFYAMYSRCIASATSEKGRSQSRKGLVEVCYGWFMVRQNDRSGREISCWWLLYVILSLALAKHPSFQVPVEASICRICQHHNYALNIFNREWVMIQRSSIVPLNNLQRSLSIFKPFKPTYECVKRCVVPVSWVTNFDPRWYVLGRVIEHKGIASCGTLATLQGLQEKDSCTGNPVPNIGN